MSPWFQAKLWRRPRRDERALRRRGAIRPAGREEEPVGIGERSECRSPEWIRRHHVKRLHLRLVRERDHDVVLDRVRVRVQPAELTHLTLERASRGIGLAGIAGDVDVRRVVRVHREVRRVTELRPDHPPQVAVDLTDAVVVACDVDAVASRRCRLVADEVVSLVDREHEERVALVDPVGGEPVEELRERVVVVLELLDVAGLAGPVREVDVSSVSVTVMRVGNVRVGDRNAGLLHLRGPGERNGRLHAVEAGEADVAVRVLDDVAVEVGHRTVRLDHRIDVLGAEQTLVAVVAAGLVRKQVGSRAWAGCADVRALGAVHADTDVVGERLRCSDAGAVAGRLNRPRASRCRTPSRRRCLCSRGPCWPSRPGRRHSRPGYTEPTAPERSLPFSLIISGVKSVWPAGGNGGPAGSNNGAVQ